MSSRRNALGRLALMLAPAALGACAAAPMGDALRRSRAADVPASAHLHTVGFVPQEDTLCGPATLAMLLRHAGFAADLPTLVEQVYLPGRQGTLQAEMLAGARRQGSLAMVLPAHLEALLAEVADGRPVGVLLNLGLAAWPRWHYAAVIGYDLNQGTVVLHSGQRAGDIWSLAPFEQTWSRSGHWSFVTLAPGRLPRSATPETLLQALLAADRVPRAAGWADSWAAASARWPADLALAVGEGNAWQSTGRLDEAAAVFARAAQRHDSAVAWNNLAMVQARQGQLPAARLSAQRALARALHHEPQWLDAVQGTLRDIGP